MDKLGKWVIDFIAAAKTLFDQRTVWLAFLPFAILFFVDPAWAKTLAQITASTVVLVGVSHFLRKFMFPGFELQEAMTKACEDSLPASIVVFAVLIFLTTLMVLLAGSLK
jgi:hypothetical protein